MTARPPQIAELGSRYGHTLAPGHLAPIARASGHAAEIVIIRTAAVLCGLWIVGTLPALLSSESGQIQVWLGGFVLTVVAAFWFASLVIRRLPPWTLVVAVALGALIEAGNTVPTALTLPYVAAVPIANLAVCMTAVLLPGRTGLWAAIAVGAGVLVIVLVSAVISATIGEAWRGCLLFGAYPIGVGVAAFGTVSALRAAAAKADDAAEERLIASVAETDERIGRDERFRVARLLHDTVINTFGAIGGGLALTRPDLIRERCARDLSVLRRATNPLRSADPSHDEPSDQPVECDVMAAARSQARLLDLQVVTTPKLAQNIVAPRRVVGAVLGAVDEALLNTAKHSGSKVVDVSVSATTESFDVRVRDRGRGLLSVPIASGRPTPPSISARCAVAGVAAEVGSAPGGGTSVRLSWHSVDSAEPASDPASGQLRQSLPLVARWVTTWFSLIFAVEVLITWGSGVMIGQLLALAVLLVATSIAIRVSFTRLPIPWAASLLLAVAAGLTTYLPTYELSGCERFGLPYWGSMGGTVCVIVIVLLLGGIGLTILGSAAVVVSVTLLSLQLGPDAGACAWSSLPAMLLTDVALVIAMLLFRRMLTHRERDAATSEREAVEALTRMAAMREQERLRSGQLEAVVRVTNPLLAGLASGELDPSDAQVRAQCSRIEEYLRSLIRIDPDLGALGDVVAQTIVAAQKQGALLVVRSAEQVCRPNPVALAGIQAILTDLTQRLRPGDRGWLTLYPHPDGASLAVLIPAAAAPAASVLGAVGTGQPVDGARPVEVLVVAEDAECLLELSWDDPSSPAHSGT